MTVGTHSAAELRERGRQARSVLPRENLSEYRGVDRDVSELLNTQNASRITELLPLRAERMSQNPFSFYRGSALVMAHDLAQQSSPGIDLVICGDAHISNFGLFASPERTLIFDLNDFDEAATGPFEWDLRRLLTSVVLAGRSLNFSDAEITDATRDAASKYREVLNELVNVGSIDRMFVMTDEHAIRDVLRGDASLELFEHAAKKAKKRTGERASAKLLKSDERGQVRFVEDPPILTRAQPESAEFIQQLFDEYLRTVRPDVSLTLSTYQIADVALRVVGVGSVGTRCYLVALVGPSGERVILQIKEATNSVVTQFHASDEPTIRVLPPDSPQGLRVVTYQQVMQAASDPFLGHIEGRLHNYYVRQFRDQKGGLDVEDMDLNDFRVYTRGCASLLARAHSQSPLAIAVSGYLGGKPVADDAFAEWARQYADQTERDFARFTEGL